MLAYLSFVECPPWEAFNAAVAGARGGIVGLLTLSAAACRWKIAIAPSPTRLCATLMRSVH